MRSILCAFTRVFLTYALASGFALSVSNGNLTVCKYVSYSSFDLDDFFHTIRRGCVYTFIEWSRKKPMRVMPALSASSTARLEGAEMAAMQGMRASRAFWIIS